MNEIGKNANSLSSNHSKYVMQNVSDKLDDNSLKNGFSNYHIDSETKSLDESFDRFFPNGRNSPIQGKAPRNSPFREHEIKSLEGSAGEPFVSETSMEPSDASEFRNDYNLRDSDIKDCAKGEHLLNSEKVDRNVDKSDISVQSNNVVLRNRKRKLISAKSEDKRALVQKRFQIIVQSPKNNCSKKQKQRSSRGKCKRQKTWNLLDRFNVRLTRSQKKGPQQGVPTSIGTADDDSGIQDIYEFTEKESNLEDISLPNRVCNIREKYSESRNTTAEVMAALEPWQTCNDYKVSYNVNSKNQESRRYSVCNDEITDL